MAYQVTVTDGREDLATGSLVSWVVAHTSNARVALRWARCHRVKLAGTFANVAVWDTKEKVWLADGNDDREGGN